jgi:hypothetical protein
MEDELSEVQRKLEMYVEQTIELKSKASFVEPPPPLKQPEPTPTYDEVIDTPPLLVRASDEGRSDDSATAAAVAAVMNELLDTVAPVDVVDTAVTADTEKVKNVQANEVQVPVADTPVVEAAVTEQAEQGVTTSESVQDIAAIDSIQVEKPHFPSPPTSPNTHGIPVDMDDIEAYVQKRIREAMEAQNAPTTATDEGEKLVVIPPREESPRRHRYSHYEESDYDIQGL